MEYETYRMQIIKSNKLALIYYISVLLIAVSYVSYIIFIGDLLVYDTPRGVIRVSIGSDDIDMISPDWDEFNTVIPQPVDSDYAFFTTTITQQVSKWNETGNSWDRIYNSPNKVLKDLDLMVKIEHTMFAPNFVQKEPSIFDQWLIKFFGKLIPFGPQSAEEFTKSSRDTAGEFGDKRFKQQDADEFLLSDLYKLAGLNLNDFSDVPNHEKESFYERGAVLQVGINYSNELKNKRGTGDITYSYEAQRVKRTGYKLSQKVAKFDYPGAEEEDPSAIYRYVEKRHGVYVKFIQTGNLARFSADHLLLQIVFVNTLVAAIPTIIDLISCYVSPAYFTATRSCKKEKKQ